MIEGQSGKQSSSRIKSHESSSTSMSSESDLPSSSKLKKTRIHNSKKNKSNNIISSSKNNNKNNFPLFDLPIILLKKILFEFVGNFSTLAKLDSAITQKKYREIYHDLLKDSISYKLSVFSKDTKVTGYKLNGFLNWINIRSIPLTELSIQSISPEIIPQLVNNSTIESDNLETNQINETSSTTSVTDTEHLWLQQNLTSLNTVDFPGLEKLLESCSNSLKELKITGDVLNIIQLIKYLDCCPYLEELTLNYNILEEPNNKTWKSKKWIIKNREVHQINLKQIFHPLKVLNIHLKSFSFGSFSYIFKHINELKSFNFFGHQILINQGGGIIKNLIKYCKRIEKISIEGKELMDDQQLEYLIINSSYNKLIKNSDSSTLSTSSNEIQSPTSTSSSINVEKNQLTPSSPTSATLSSTSNSSNITPKSSVSPHKKVLRYLKSISFPSTYSPSDEALEVFLIYYGSSLESLSINNCKDLNNRSLYNIVKYCKKLKKLELINNENFKGGSLIYFINNLTINHLEYLTLNYLENFNFTNVLMNFLSRNNKKLKKLCIKNNNKSFLSNELINQVEKSYSNYIQLTLINNEKYNEDQFELKFSNMHADHEKNYELMKGYEENDINNEMEVENDVESQVVEGNNLLHTNKRKRNGSYSSTSSGSGTENETSSSYTASHSSSPLTTSSETSPSPLHGHPPHLLPKNDFDEDEDEMEIDDDDDVELKEKKRMKIKEFMFKSLATASPSIGASNSLSNINRELKRPSVKSSVIKSLPNLPYSAESIRSNSLSLIK